MVMMRALLLLGALLAAPLCAADDPPTEFSKQVMARTGDWVAEDWRDGALKLHPKQYTWQSDVHVTFYAEEPVAGRALADVARFYHQGYSLDDDTTDPTLVDMAGAKEMAPGILAKSYRWSYAFDDNTSLFGVIATARNSYVPFQMNCEADDPDLPDAYRFDQCVRKGSTLLLMVQGGPAVAGQELPLPEPPAPMIIPGWREQYLPDGTSVAVNSNFYGTRSATVRVSPPRTLDASQLPAAIKAMSDSLIEDNDQTDENPGTALWVGTTADPWIRREYPKAFDGPSIHMAGAERMPDGRIALIGVRCPNKGWQGSCAKGVESAKLQVRLGLIEGRRQRVIAATKVALPTDGLKDAQILGIYTEGRNTMGYGGYMTGYEVDGFVYLRDGTVLDDLDRVPALINVANSRASEPKRWGRWQRVGNKMVVSWADGDRDDIEIDGKNLMVGGTPATRLSGWYRNVSGGGNTAFGGGVAYLNESSYTFFADGTFESDRSSGFTSGPGMGGDGVTVAGGSSGTNGRGRYEINGYTMKLTYPDGRLSYLSVAVYAHEANKAEKDFVMLNGTNYFRDSDGK
jgi:hypothetical protein